MSTPAAVTAAADTIGIARAAALPAEQREVLSLAFWSGLSQSEIAARTSVPLGTVKTRVRLGMAKLRERLIGTGLL